MATIDDRNGWWSGFLAWLTRRPKTTLLLLAGATVAGALIVALATGTPRPGVSDEFAYLLAADTFANGRLTNPPHPLWESFENYYLLHQPTYSSKFPPGQGLLLAVGQLLGHPVIGVWLGGAMMVAAVLWMLRAWLPPRWALLGAVLAALLFAVAGVWVQSYMPGTLAATGGALLYGGLRRILRDPHWRDATLLGLGVVLMALSRPYEGVVVSLPAALILLVWLLRAVRAGAWRTVGEVVLPIVGVLAVGAGWTLAHNRAVTGDLLTMPYQAQHQVYPIIPIFAWQQAEVGHEYRHWFLTRFERGQRHVLLEKFPPGLHWQTIQRRFERFRAHFLPGWTWLPLLLLPLGLRDRWTIAAFGVCLFVWAGQLVTVPMLAHYFAPIAPLLVFLMVQCVRVAERLPVPRRMVPLTVVAVVVLFAHSTIAKARTDNRHRWEAIETERPRIEQELIAAGGKHVVLVRYGPQYNIHRTWVYNSADIDSQTVIWANQMSSWWNERLKDYYPDREFWLVSMGFGPGEDAPPVLTPYAPPGEDDPGVRVGELPGALSWLAEHPESRVREIVGRSLSKGRFESVVVPGTANARAFRVSPDRWTRGAAPGVILIASREAAIATPRLRLAVNAGVADLPINVVIADGNADKSVTFDKPGVRHVELPAIEPGDTSVVLISASRSWSPANTDRVLGVKIVGVDLPRLRLAADQTTIE